jgi:hypothetical protein
MRKWIVYRGTGCVFVTTPKCERDFIARAKEWGYDLEDEFDREETKDVCVMVTAALVTE